MSCYRRNAYARAGNLEMLWHKKENGPRVARPKNAMTQEGKIAACSAAEIVLNNHAGRVLMNSFCKPNFENPDINLLSCPQITKVKFFRTVNFDVEADRNWTAWNLSFEFKSFLDDGKSKKMREN